MLRTGSRIAFYEVVGLLGQGGMGQVFEAEHVLLGRRAALKTVLTDLADDEEYRVRLIRESQAVASIDHPNIIPIYDAGEAENTAYIAMRFVRGCDLATLLERRSRLEPSEALRIVDQAAAALDAAHARGLIHRDVKPANILLEDESNRVYLTDFGIVKRQGQAAMTRPGYFLGTVDYAAPEQIEGKEIGPAADLYALGCVLFECLSGAKPYTGRTPMDVIRAHVLDPPPTLTGVRPGFPAELDDVVARVLAKDPSARYESCRVFVEDARMALGAAGTEPVPRLGAAVSAPAVEPLPAATALPAPTTPLVGREQELGEVLALLRGEPRLVTLTGFGGTGKTRLALGAAQQLRAELDLVGFVDLSRVRDAAFVGPTIAAAVGCGDPGDRPLAHAIHDRLSGGTALLVLDNFEQVVAAAPFVADLLATVPELKLLVTSQRPLRVSGEYEYAVPPLSLPPATGAAGADSLSRIPAVEFFVERARAVRPGFEMTDANAEAVGEICKILDGIPLAIELAAARIKLLTPQALRDRLHTRLDLLVGGAANQPERQRTLRDAIDWSVQLLEEQDQALLTRLGVFVGGCSLEAAESIAGRPFGVDLGPLVESLAALVDKSLVRQLEAADGEPRFAMLETIREYALGRLETRGDAELVRRSHADHFLALVEAAEEELTRPNQGAWLARLDEEHGNIRAAFSFALDAGDTRAALRFCTALVRFWSIRGHAREGREWLHAALAAADDVPQEDLARAEFAAGYAALGLGEFPDADRHFRRSLELAAGDVRAQAAARAQLAWLAMSRETDGAGDAAELAAASLAGARETGDKQTASGALATLAELALRRGDTDEALALFEESLALRRGLGDKRLVANSLLGLARARLARGETTATQQLLERGLEHAREIGDTWTASVALAGLGRLRLDDDPAGALEQLREALRLAAGRGDKRAVADCLQGIAGALAVTGRADDAARLAGAADGLLDQVAAELTPAERSLEDRLHTLLAGREHVRDAGRELDLEEAVASALAAASAGAPALSG